MLIPTSLGYGTSFSTAEVKTNDSYWETLGYNDEWAYYKVFCNTGDLLAVSVRVDYPIFDIDLVIFDSNEHVVEQELTIVDSVTLYTDVHTNTYYYIRIDRNAPRPGEISFALTIAGASGTDPATIMLAILISVISGVAVIAIVIFLLIRRRRK